MRFGQHRPSICSYGENVVKIIGCPAETGKKPNNGLHHTAEQGEASKSPSRGGDFLAFLLFDFVASEILLGFGKDNVLFENWIVFAKAEFIWGVHRILLGVVLTNVRLFRDEANKFALSIILFCHNYRLFYHILSEK